MRTSSCRIDAAELGQARRALSDLARRRTPVLRSPRRRGCGRGRRAARNRSSPRPRSDSRARSPRPDRSPRRRRSPSPLRSRRRPDHGAVADRDAALRSAPPDGRGSRPACGRSRTKAARGRPRRRPAGRRVTRAALQTGGAARQSFAAGSSGRRRSTPGPAANLAIDAEGHVLGPRLVQRRHGRRTPASVDPCRAARAPVSASISPSVSGRQASRRSAGPASRLASGLPAQRCGRGRRLEVLAVEGELGELGVRARRPRPG